MKAYSIFFGFFLIVTSAISQDLNDSQNVISNSGTALYSFDKTDKSVVGSPYIQESFVPAKVITKTEKIFNLRYNAVNDEMEIESEQSKNPTINKNISGLVITFIKDNKSYNAMTYFNDQGNSTVGFLVPLTDKNQNVKLYLKERIAFYQGQPAKSSYQDAKSPKFDRVSDMFFIAIKNEIAKPLSSNKKEIAALFPNHEKDILNYISSEKLNVKKQGDLIKLAGYLNQLSQ